MDDVTTALELEVGASPVNEWYAAREGKSLVDFGASAGPIPARMTVMHDAGKSSSRRLGVTVTLTLYRALSRSADNGRSQIRSRF